MGEFYITEAFRQLDILDEEDFNLSFDNNDYQEISDFMEDDDEIDVIDPQAEDEDELEDSYEGKVILDCEVCHSKLYKDPEKVIIEDDIANIDDECPFCYSTEGFKVIGQVAPYIKEEPEADDEEVEEPEDKPEDAGDNESPEEEVEEPLKENLEKVDIETEDQIMSMESDEDGKVVVITEPKKDPEEGETIEPIDDEMKDEIINGADDEVEDEVEFDFDDFDEDSFNELGESYLKSVYENIDSYKTASVKQEENKLFIEGIIKFNSGKQKKTSFVFEAKDATKSGRVKFIGENAQISRGKKSFTITGSINESKFIAESFNYNYTSKDVDGKSTKLYGTIRKQS